MNLNPKMYGTYSHRFPRAKEKYCARCHKYHRLTSEHWHPLAGHPHGLGNQCKHFVGKPKHPQLNIGQTPKCHKAIDNFLRHPTRPA